MTDGRFLGLRKEEGDSTSHLFLHPGVHPALAGHPLFNGAQNVGLITAEKPVFHPLDRSGNPGLAKRLKQMGLRHEATRGCYGGTKENSFVVYGPSREQMHRLGHIFGQEAVVHHERGGRHELIHTNGPDSGRYHIPFEDVHFFGTEEPVGQTNYTHLPGRGWFNINFNFKSSEPPKSRLWTRHLTSLPRIEAPVTKDEMNPTGRPRTIGHGSLWTPEEFAAEIAKSPHFPQNAGRLVAGVVPSSFNKSIPSRSSAGSLQSFVANPSPILNKPELRVSVQKTYTPPEVCRELAKAIRAVASDFEALRKREVNARGRKLRKNAMDLCPMCGNADMPGICTCVPLAKNAQMGYPPKTPGMQPPSPQTPVPGSHGKPAGMVKEEGMVNPKMHSRPAVRGAKPADVKASLAPGMTKEEAPAGGKCKMCGDEVEDYHAHNAKSHENEKASRKKNPKDPIFGKDEKSPGSVKLPPKKGGKTVEASEGSGGDVSKGKKLNKAELRKDLSGNNPFTPNTAVAPSPATADPPYPRATRSNWAGMPALRAALGGIANKATHPDVLSGHAEARAMQGASPAVRTGPPPIPKHVADASMRPARAREIPLEPDSSESVESITGRNHAAELHEDKAASGMGFFNKIFSMFRRASPATSPGQYTSKGVSRALNRQASAPQSQSERMSSDATWNEPSTSYSQGRAMRAMGTRMARSENTSGAPVDHDEIQVSADPHVREADAQMASFRSMMGDCPFCHGPEHPQDCTS